jgi:hypothetical protein
MKKVFSSNYDVIHLFAQRTQDEARTQTNNVFFKNNELYSYGYHYLLAEFINEETILINNTSYSNSTSKHINIITQASRQYKQYFFEEICLSNVYNTIKDASKKLINARKKEVYASTIIKTFESFESFFNEFNFCFYYSNSFYNGYHKQEKNLIVKNDNYKEIKKIYKAIKKDENKYIEEGKERVKKEIEKAKQKLKQDLNKFFNYKIDYVNSKQIEEDYLRISEDKQHVETSQKIKISIDEAKKLYYMIENKKDIQGYRIENYTVISLNGVLKIGCHKINVKNVHEIGQQLKTI